MCKSITIIIIIIIIKDYWASHYLIKITFKGLKSYASYISILLIIDFLLVKNLNLMLPI